MNRVDRLFGITILLQARKYVPAERIAGQFHISVRTVYRDIKALAEQGIPVSFEVGRGYFLVPGYFLPPPGFTADEANALILLGILGTALADQSIQPHVLTALQKVKVVLRGPAQDRVGQLADSIRLRVPEYREGNTTYLATIQAAIASRYVLEMEYQDKAGARTQRRIEPIGLVFYNFAWQLVGWCQLRGAYREFRVARMHRLTATTQPFTNQAPLSLAEYLASLNLPPAD